MTIANGWRLNVIGIGCPGTLTRLVLYLVLSIAGARCSMRNRLVCAD